jgi:predicted phage terminase large subunit-like protein
VREVAYAVPAALEHQAPIMVADARNKVVCAGRRFGKTVLCLKVSLQGHGPVIDDETSLRKFKGAAHGGRIWWLAPVYHQAAGVWAGLKHATKPRSNRERLDRDTVVSKSEVEKTIWFPGGGAISVKTADDPDNLRGSGLDGVILDEAAFMKEEVWYEVIRPALLDRGGWAFFISTPNGMNWFYDIFEGAERDGWARWKQPTWDNPVISQDEIEVMRNEPGMSRLRFQQEIEAEFVAAGAGMFEREMFRYYTNEAVGFENYHVLDQRRVDFNDIVKFSTVDLAVTTSTQSHYTVISTWAVTPQSDLLLLDVDRFRGEGPDIVPRIRVAYDKWRPSYVGIERVGFQMAVVQEAARQGLPVHELKPHRDKVARAMTAVAMLEQGKVWWPRGTSWMKELEDEVVMFPEGEFDDFVDTLSYACAEVAGERFDQVVAPIGLSRSAPWRIT